MKSSTNVLHLDEARCIMNSMKDLNIQHGEQVRIYWNLHKRCFSVQTWQARGWRVAGHTNTFALKGATFTVSKAGRERVRRERRKNVHAFIWGQWFPDGIIPVPLARVTYNPYEMEQFQIVGSGEISYADFVTGAENQGRPSLLVA